MKKPSRRARFLALFSLLGALMSFAAAAVVLYPIGDGQSSPAQAVQAVYIGPASLAADASKAFQLRDSTVVTIPFEGDVSPMEEVTLYSADGGFYQDPFTRFPSAFNQPIRLLATTLLLFLGSSLILLCLILLTVWEALIRGSDALTPARTGLSNCFAARKEDLDLKFAQLHSGASAALLGLGPALLVSFLSLLHYRGPGALLLIFSALPTSAFAGLLALFVVSLAGSAPVLFLGSRLRYGFIPTTPVAELDLLERTPRRVFAWLERKGWDEETFMKLAPGFEGDVQELLETSSLLK